MSFLIKWQFTKENPVRFKTQAEIISSHLVSLVEDESFQDKILSFYITKQELTDVRLAVFVKGEKLEMLKNIVQKHTSSLKSNPRNNDWDGNPVKDPYLSDCEGSFHKEYLQDITWIGVGLHKKI